MDTLFTVLVGGLTLFFAAVTGFYACHLYTARIGFWVVLILDGGIPQDPILFAEREDAYAFVRTIYPTVGSYPRGTTVSVLHAKVRL